MHIAKITLFLLLIVSITCSPGSSQDRSDQSATLAGGPCEGCEGVFEYGNRPLTPTDTLPGFEEADEKLKVTGIIYRPDGETPAEGVILYIYHTNEQGIYPTRGDEAGWGRRHGYIRGWIRTGPDGRYTFYTRKPGSYGENPAHIHPIILEPDDRYYYLTDYRFRGDPYLEENDREYRGSPGVISLRKEGELLVAERDIVLGKNVPGYE